jgi:Rps23 Pro-64 3,4-dihydroxylase Tpa1-like proline 4-hydroxylase
MSVKKFDDIFSEELYNEIYDFVTNVVLTKQKSLTTNRVWANNLVNNSTPIMRYVFDVDDKELFTKISKEIKNKTDYVIQGGLVHIFPKLSYITWHNDAHVQSAITIYLNKKWDENWGGIFLYREDDKITGIIPKKNLGILQTNGVEHCVTTTNIDADDRISLQFFIGKRKSVL